MKKLIFLFISIFSLVALNSCDKRDDIRKDIDDLNSRLDQLEANLPQFNEDISNYQGLLDGKLLVMGYSLSENGDYTVELSNGETIHVCSGNPTEELPLLSIGEGGWYYTQDGETYPLMNSNGQQAPALGETGVTPQIRVDAQGMWEYSLDGGLSWLGNIGPANPGKGSAGTSIFTGVKVADDGSSLTFGWKNGDETLSKTISLYGGLALTVEYGSGPVAFALGESREFNVTQEGVENVVIETNTWGVKLDETKIRVTAPVVNTQGKEYEDNIILKIFSKEGYCRVVKVPVKLLTTTIDENSATAWQNFLFNNAENVLLDYSYAGYDHGESVPVDGFAWGYKVINVKDRMDKDHLSAREALIKILDENKLVRVSSTSATNANAKIVIYFPAGDYDLQPEGNSEKFPEIYGGNFVIKGDGAGKTRLMMNNSIGTSESTTAPLLAIKHTNSPTNINNSKVLATVSENAAKGSFSVKVESTSGLSSGKWVQLRLRSGDDALLKEELGPIYNQKKAAWSVAQQPGLSGSNEDGKGINVMEFHQIKSVSGNVVTFYEPIMHEVNVAYKDYDGGWVIRDYKYFENVGVEDLSFVGKAITPYYHHGEGQDESKAWLYDSGYVPLQLNRVVNSWVRNVSFESVSEAITFGESANCSAYNITITGNRGHSAVRAQGSSRVFIGKVQDESADSRGHGQWHGCGVSKPSIGTVVWNCNWGQDACFESHATQPRATLFDNCRGGLVRYHAGGAENEAPNHLADLTLWNLYVTGTTDEKGENFASDFKWWDAGNIWWKICPPIVVGTHGNAVTFSKEEGQVTYEESTGAKVTPESLYEAQLQKRLGYVPAWLNALK